jgi:hypothetical protein
MVVVDITDRYLRGFVDGNVGSEVEIPVRSLQLAKFPTASSKALSTHPEQLRNLLILPLTVLSDW